MSKHQTTLPAGVARLRRPWLLPLLIALSLLLPLLSLNIGFYGATLQQIYAYLLHGAEAVEPNIPVIVRNIRVPRIAAAFLIGAGLAVAGAAYQGMFKNPLVSPDILGVSQGAGLGACLALLLGWSSFGVQAAAFCFGVVTVFLTYLIGSRAKFGQAVSLVLAGTMLRELCNASITVIKYVADPNDVLPAITYWLMGSLSKVDTSDLLFSLTPMALGMLALFLLRWRLNLLTLGDEEAMAIGVDPRKVRLAAILAATIISAGAVCLGGLIGWVGLMVPHIARGLAGADYRRMLPVAALMGGCFLLVMDDLARSLMALEIPIGVLTALFGAPFFVMLILRRGKA
ncbi:MAG: iron ABC transporter permease [Bacillota bacterium]|nr:iron ABC transporter permease [Bacillota bacterium]